MLNLEYNSFQYIVVYIAVLQVCFRLQLERTRQTVSNRK